jgi:membrane protease YdiL (CAAX protease family)
MHISRRLLIFLVTTFALTWGGWWSIAILSPVEGLTFGNPLILTLYLLGGFGPTIGAFIAVLATPADGSMREFAGRLFKWRVSAVWFAIAFGLPALLGLLHAAIALAFAPAGASIGFEPLWRILPLFGMMIVGGGLEELGWRGVALPELENTTSKFLATLVVSVIWVAWHLPLFFIHGVTQYHGNFALFALYTSANSFLLAWLYFKTRSILLCVFFHAASNTTTAMIVLPESHNAAPDAISAAIALALGIALVLVPTRRRRYSRP